jgi:hypothetical protein
VRYRNNTCIYENHPSQSPRQRLTHGQTTEFDFTQKPREPIPIDRASTTSRGSTIPSHPSSSLVSSSTGASTPASQPSARDIESMRSRIRQLEEQLAEATLKSIQASASTSNSNIETKTSRIGGTFHLHRESDQSQAITRSVTHKTRLFGQSHWINVFTLVCYCATIRLYGTIK